MGSGLVLVLTPPTQWVMIKILGDEVCRALSELPSPRRRCKMKVSTAGGKPGGRDQLDTRTLLIAPSHCPGAAPRGKS